MSSTTSGLLAARRSNTVWETYVCPAGSTGAAGRALEQAAHGTCSMRHHKRTEPMPRPGSPAMPILRGKSVRPPGAVKESTSENPSWSFPAGAQGFGALREFPRKSSWAQQQRQQTCSHPAISITGTAQHSATVLWGMWCCACTASQSRAHQLDRSR